MPKLKNRYAFQRAHLQSIGILCLLLLAVLLLWYGNTNSNQAQSPSAAQVRFQGEYRIGDAPWQEIVEGAHIPSTKGDVTLRGNFHILTPNGEYVGIYNGKTPIALYINHISLTIRQGETGFYTTDIENPLYGHSACGVSWTAHNFSSESTDPIEILIHNPHNYGNETAIDQLLSGIAFWSGVDFEKNVLARDEAQRIIGLSFIIISLSLLGIALFSTLIHLKNSNLLWLFGLIILFAGTYFTYSAESISLSNGSVISNTILLECAMMFYMLFLSMIIVYFLVSAKKLGYFTIICLSIADGLFLILPIVTDIFFYNLLVYWIAIQLIVNIILIVCLVRECFSAKKKNIALYAGAILPLIAFGVDAVMTGYGIWQGGTISKNVFVILFVAAMVLVLQIIPSGINAAAKAKELEAEKSALNAQLAESRISTMISQIRPHFIYNTLGSIEQLCEINPQKAGELVHNFAKYLRGNFGELDNPRPIFLSQEMEHVQHYISIENVRFPDMTFSFEMNSNDFHIPALSIQPIVENAIKHGLMKLPKGGTIRVKSYETDTHFCVSVTDDGVGFDTGELLDDRKHVGIRNIRERLKAMVNGTLEINSTIGAGTTVLITIPKEVQK